MVLIAVAAVVAAAATVVLLLPTSCAANDAPPGTPAPPDECPRGSTAVGIVWPNMYLGWALVPLLALGTGALAGAVVARRTDEGPR